MTIREIYKNSEQFLNKEVKLGGWIRSIRGSKHFGFLVLHDGTFFKPIQVVYDECWSGGDRRGNAGSNSAGKAAI